MICCHPFHNYILNDEWMRGNMIYLLISCDQLSYDKYSPI